MTKYKIILVVLCWLAGSVGLQAKNALLVIAHGSPMDSWQKPVLEMENVLNSKIKERKLHGIDYVRVAFMEYVEPSIASVVKDCEAAGIDSIYAVPLFIAPSSHTDEDLPNILNQKYNFYIRRDLAAQGTKIVKTKIPITIGYTFYYSTIMERVMLDRIKEFTKDQGNEGVIFVAHGEEERIGFWKEMLKSVCEYVKENTKINYTDTKLIEMGHAFDKEVLPLLEKASESKHRLLVQGIYLVSDVKRMAERAKMNEKQADALKGKNVEVVYSGRGILPASTDLITDWILEQMAIWLKNK